MAPHPANGTNGSGRVHDHRRKPQPRKVPSRLSLSGAPSLSQFQELCSQTTHPATYPLAHSIQKNIPIYELHSLEFASPQKLSGEWHHILLSGPGVLVLKHMYPTPFLTTTNAIFDSILTHEKSVDTSKGDHFSGGTNDRIWNSFSKHCLTDPQSFLLYYSIPFLHLMCTTWLGPSHRITAQLNIVNPGGPAQMPHRDYHLGFQSPEDTAQYPLALQVASQHLTLQGAIAHTDMPLESGPTRFLPFSQMFAEGFLAYRLPEFIEFFEKNYVALPLAMGDAVFFNPALFHAAGANETKDFRRIANLLQISAAFGKAMESVDSIPLVEACWDVLKEKFGKEGFSEEVLCGVRTVAEGYPFPTNLDRRAPGIGGMAPESEQDVVMRGLREDWSREEMVRVLRRLREEGRA